MTRAGRGEEPEGRVMWTFIRERAEGYQEILGGLDLGPGENVHVELVEYNAFRRRLLSGFYSGTPLPDILEVERDIVSSTFRGPLDAVGFVDLTDRLEREGLMERINNPSFSPWTNRGHIFGLPADVHPVLLLYRADVFEAGGIDVSELDTWNKFFAATAKLVQDLDGDGNPDQYVMEMPEAEALVAETLLLQAGGHLIDIDGQCSLSDPVNVEILAQLADWATGEDKVTADVSLFSGSGNRLRAEGFVLSWVVPDWRARDTEMYLGGLAGKVKLMPLPAWEEGGRRTSAWGGTMIGFPKGNDRFEKDWEFAKRLYLSRELAVKAWKKFSVLTPAKEFWDDPVFHKPDPFYMGQQKGTLFIEQADCVPVRSSSPYLGIARQEMLNALAGLVRWARSNNVEDPDLLESKAAELLEKGQQAVIRQMNRNHFLNTPSDTAAK